MHNRIVRSYRQHIDAPPEVVFPLICPVQEAEWLEGWAEGYELIYSASGLAEKDCVFRTFGDGEPEMIWTISEHNSVGRVVEFVRVAAGLVATTLRVSIMDDEDRKSEVEITYLITPLTEAGAAFAVARYEPTTFHHAMQWWETSLNHYVRTGECLRASSPQGVA